MLRPSYLGFPSSNSPLSSLLMPPSQADLDVGLRDCEKKEEAIRIWKEETMIETIKLNSYKAKGLYLKIESANTIKNLEMKSSWI